LKNTYLDTLSGLTNARTGRVHAHFNQTVAETGRLSSSDPNLQNIPIKTDLGREIRRAFVSAPRQVLLSADYSQIELRILAHYCGEQALLDAFASNRDVHRLVAAELNHVPEEQVTPEMRAIAKTVNFGIIYGQTGFGLSQVLKIPKEEANAYITAYRRRFPAIEQFTHECIQQAMISGYVTTILGRRRAIPDINSPVQSRRQFGQRAALNSVIQGSAADLIKLAMVNIHRKVASHAQSIKMLMQIHDELVFEVRADELERWKSLVREEMEGAMKLRVPLKVDIGVGKNWLEYD
jgi:DNA polymerase-1